MITTNKLTGETIEIDHYSDYFSNGVNEYCEKLNKSIFHYNGYRIQIKDIEGTLKWHSMTQEQFNNSGLSYKYYESLDFIKIENFLELLTQLEQADSTFRNSEKGIKLFIDNLKEEWNDYVDTINDSE